MDYLLDDYVAAFHTALTGILMRRGVQLASEGHFTADADNAHGIAVAAARRIFQERNRFRPEVAKQTPIQLDPPKATGKVKA